MVLARHEVVRLCIGAAGWNALPRSSTQRSNTWTGRDVMQAVFAPLLQWEGRDVPFSWSADGVSVRGGRLFGGPLKAKHIGGATKGILHCVAHGHPGKGEAACALANRIIAVAHEFLSMRPPGHTHRDLLPFAPEFAVDAVETHRAFALEVAAHE